MENNVNVLKLTTC